MVGDHQAGALGHQVPPPIAQIDDQVQDRAGDQYVEPVERQPVQKTSHAAPQPTCCPAGPGISAQAKWFR